MTEFKPEDILPLVPRYPRALSIWEMIEDAGFSPTFPTVLKVEALLRADPNMLPQHRPAEDTVWSRRT